MDLAHTLQTTILILRTMYFFIQLPSNVSLLNEFMCGPLNREGQLCGKCKDGIAL